MTAWQMNRQCAECPWRRDVAPGQFPLERYEALRGSVEQGWGRLFACHKSPEEDKRACVGYVLNQITTVGGPQNFNLRRLLSSKKIEPEKMTLVGPQYDNYDEMVEANSLAEEKKSGTTHNGQGRREARARHESPGDSCLLRRKR